MTSIVATFAYGLVVALHVALASFKVNFSDSGQLVRIVLSWIVALVLGIFGFMLVNLIILHIQSSNDPRLVPRKAREKSILIFLKSRWQSILKSINKRIVLNPTRMKTILRWFMNRKSSIWIKVLTNCPVF